MSAEYPESLQRLIAQLRRMPGVGPRSAERIALWIVLGRSQGSVKRGMDIADAIRDAAENVQSCQQCGFFSTVPLCEFCRDPKRVNGPICVVEQPTDILPLERTHVFQGQYHALGGRLSPLDHVGPDDLRIASLLDRVKSRVEPTEVILALGADVEGEATSQYLASLLADFPNVTVSRIAQGISVGGGLEAADELTLTRALTGRVSWKGRA